MCIVICTLLLSRPARGAWVEIRAEARQIASRRCRAPQGARGLKCITVRLNSFSSLSRAPQGARGLKFNPCNSSNEGKGRAPQGARGLKYVNRHTITTEILSRPARGAWVEIMFGSSLASSASRRAPQGARGLKYCVHRLSRVFPGRAPQGARGLKSAYTVQNPYCCKSRPARGAWVEIF